MPITPVSSGFGITPVGSMPAESPRPTSARRIGIASAADAATAQLHLDSAKDLRELKQLASQSGLEVRFVTLPDSNATLLRLVDPQTGRVMREFPPEGVAIALAELRARAAAHPDHRALDHQA
jgi:hypothetical protein